MWRITIRKNQLSFFPRSYTTGLNYGHWYCNMAEYSLFMTAFIFHCHDIDWLSSLVPGLFPVVSLSSDVTSPGDKAGIAPILNQAEVSTRTYKVLFSWFSFLLFSYGEGVALSRPFRSSHRGWGIGTLILTRDVLSWNKIWRSSCAWGSACM